MSVKNIMMSKKVAASVAIVLILIGIYFLQMAILPKEVEKKATIEDLLYSTSEREDFEADVIIVSGLSPWYALIGTPVAVYYDIDMCNVSNDDVCTEGGKVAYPLLVAMENMHTQEDGVSKGVINFIHRYNVQRALTVGPIPEMEISVWKSIDDDCPKKASKELARLVWKRSDGALIIKNNEDGYLLGIPTAPLASYLNIPILVAENIDEVRDVLKDLKVKYTIICGDLEGYEKVLKIKNVEDAQNITACGVKTQNGMKKSVLKDRLGITCRYISITNPYDIHQPKVLDSFTETFTGEVESKDTGSTYYPTSEDPSHTFIVPDDWEYVNIIVDSRMKFTESNDPRRDPDKDGERSYTYVGIDEDGDGGIDHLQFFIPSLAYENIRDSSGKAVEAHGYIEHPLYNSTGEHVVQIAATLHASFPPNIPINPPLPPPKTTYTITITVQKLDDPVIPYLKNASSLAPYLTAFRAGVIMGKANYTLLMHCLDPTTYEEDIESANNISIIVKKDLNDLLARLADMDGKDTSAIASYYASLHPDDAFYVAIVADTSMIPWFYYPTEGQEYRENEGQGLPSDVFYADIDADPYNVPYEIDGSDPSLELAIGRVTGWDVQDISALLSRTFFYDEIIDSYPGLFGYPWKVSAMNTFGSRVPVGLAATVTTKLTMAWRQAGYVVDTYHDVMFSDRNYAQPYYENSNFIFFCAHGFFYWYVPPGYQKDGVGGAFTVAHVKDMNFGPSVIFGSSCVTGRIDGLPLYNTLSQTFLHSGMNAYIGASRLSWGGFSLIEDDSGEVYGDYLGLLLYGYLTGYIYDRNGGLINEGIGNLPVGIALMLAKNKYIEDCGTDNGGPHDDTFEEFHLFGDPAFNPYEPNHNG